MFFSIELLFFLVCIISELLKDMQYSIAVLAGGKSQRFGSNKALFKVGGKPLITRFLLEIPKIHANPRLTYLSLRNRTQWEEILHALERDLTVTPSEVEDGVYHLTSSELQKPLTIRVVFDIDHNEAIGDRAAIFGFSSIFGVSRVGFIQFVPCDMPYFNASVIDKIYTFCESRNWLFDAVIPRWENGFIEPLNGVYRVEKLAPITQGNIKLGHLSLRDLITRDVKQASFPIEKELSAIDPNFIAFQNLNQKPTEDFYSNQKAERSL